MRDAALGSTPTSTRVDRPPRRLGVPYLGNNVGATLVKRPNPGLALAVVTELDVVPRLYQFETVLRIEDVRVFLPLSRPSPFQPRDFTGAADPGDSLASARKYRLVARLRAAAARAAPRQCSSTLPPRCAPSGHSVSPPFGSAVHSRRCPHPRDKPRLQCKISPPPRSRQRSRSRRIIAPLCALPPSPRAPARRWWRGHFDWPWSSSTRTRRRDRCWSSRRATASGCSATSSGWRARRAVAHRRSRSTSASAPDPRLAASHAPASQER